MKARKSLSVAIYATTPFVTTTKVPFYHPPLTDTAIDTLDENNLYLLANCAHRLRALDVKTSGDIFYNIVVELQTQGYRTVADKYLSFAAQYILDSSAKLIELLNQENLDLANKPNLKNLIDQLNVSRANEDFTISCMKVSTDLEGKKWLYQTFIIPIFPILQNDYSIAMDWFRAVIEKKQEFGRLFIDQKELSNPNYQTFKHKVQQISFQPTTMYDMLNISDEEKGSLTLDQLKKKHDAINSCLHSQTGEEAAFLRDILQLSTRYIGKEKGWFTETTFEWWENIETLKNCYTTRLPEMKEHLPGTIFYALHYQLLNPHATFTPYDLFNLSDEQQKNLTRETLPVFWKNWEESLYKDLPLNLIQQARFLNRFALLAYVMVLEEKDLETSSFDADWIIFFEESQLKLSQLSTLNLSPTPLHKNIRELFLSPDICTTKDVLNDEKTDLTSLSNLDIICRNLFDSLGTSSEYKEEVTILRECITCAALSFGFDQGWYTQASIKWRDDFNKKKAQFLKEHSFNDTNPPDNETYQKFKALIQREIPPPMYQLLGLSDDEYASLTPERLRKARKSIILKIAPDKLPSKFEPEANLFFNLCNLTEEKIREEKGWE